MIDIILRNKTYFTLYLLFFTALFIYQLTTPQLDAIIFFSERRSAFGDLFFKIWTLLGEAYPFVLLILFFIFKKDTPKSLLIALLGIAVLIPIYFLKEYFLHDRPALVLQASGLIQNINFVEGYEVLKGSNSFPSGHSAGAFALWTLMALFYPERRGLSVVFFTTAVLVGISRIYLVAHFPEDVLFGSAIGVFFALIISYFFEKQMRSSGSR